MRTSQETSPPREVSRRAVLRTAGVAGAVLAAGGSLAACGGSGSSAGTAAQPSSSGGSDAGSSSGTSVPTSEVPVGGGKILEAQKIVVTQPEQGTFKAFSAICTHMGCTVASVADGTITCPCHGSQYSAADGSVTRGPAPRALTPKTVTEKGDELVVT